jgi:hypothetical protein
VDTKKRLRRVRRLKVSDKIILKDKRLKGLRKGTKELYNLLCESVINKKTVKRNEVFEIYSRNVATKYGWTWKEIDGEWREVYRAWDDSKFEENFRAWFVRSLGLLLCKGHLKVVPSICFEEPERYSEAIKKAFDVPELNQIVGPKTINIDNLSNKIPLGPVVNTRTGKTGLVVKICPTCKDEHIKNDTYPYCSKECKRKYENTTPTSKT